MTVFVHCFFLEDVAFEELDFRCCLGGGSVVVLRIESV
jgi:hypothetical protein